MKRISDVLSDELERRTLNLLCGAGGLTHLFQPIVDLRTQTTLGFEILSRGVEPLRNPRDLFRAALRHGMLWDLETACIESALGAVARLKGDHRRTRFFLNVTPATFTDDRFAGFFSTGLLESHGLDPRKIIIEITEEGQTDNPLIESQSRYFASLGFQIALDDMGSGHSSLLNLIAVAPHFMKLDQRLTSSLSNMSYKHHLVRSISTFASSVNSRLIAEGVETWSDVRALIMLGIRYIQGYIAAEPAAYPPAVEGSFLWRVAAETSALEKSSATFEESIATMSTLPLSVESERVTCEEMDGMFRHNPDCDHAVITWEGRPLSLVTRQHFYLATGGRFGFALYQNRPVDSVSPANPLVVRDGMKVTSVAALAMNRDRETVYDPVVVVGEDSILIGTITVRQLLERATELEVKSAMGANPLTNLPGNRMIHRWLQDIPDSGTFSVVYCDLNCFKEYNDAYGFLMGDEMIRLTARILSDTFHESEPHALVGHIGGDDFVVVSGTRIPDDILCSICQRFDSDCSELFSPEHRLAGGFSSIDRDNKPGFTRLTTLSLAVVDDGCIGVTRSPSSIGERAASLKKRARRLALEMGRSMYAREERLALRDASTSGSEPGTVI